MGIGSEYRFHRDGRWNLLVFTQKWSRGLWAEVLDYLKDPAVSEHPQINRFRYPRGENGEEFFLKIYDRSRSFGAFKDTFRDSKAFRALRQGISLSEHGFHVPLIIAAGEERSFRFLKRAFLVSSAIKGVSLPQFLEEYAAIPVNVGNVRKKTEYIKKLALETRRLHQQGFIHGDLVPSNIVARVEKEEVTFFFIDNDRTRHYPGWFPNLLWKRNLVQLNRFALPGISLQDRMRFLHFYAGEKTWGKQNRGLIRWLEKKTRQRRAECEQIASQDSFRELMRWKGRLSRYIK
ncbi:MAG: lipopolysaccharide kinase InaA family protein [Candidatus Binatia bacterium]